MSLFTVEQLELIRRLRSTGITGEAVLEVRAPSSSVQQFSAAKFPLHKLIFARQDYAFTDETG